VRLWDAGSGAPGLILRGHSDPVRSVVFSHDGQQIASGSDDKTVRLWDARSGALVLILEGHEDDVSSVAFSPNGQRIASGSSDKTVRLWDVETGQCLVVVEGFHGAVYSISWEGISSGSYFVTGGEDRSIQKWQVVEGENHKPRVNLCWCSSQNGLVLSNASIDGVRGLSKRNLLLLLQRGAISREMVTEE